MQQIVYEIIDKCFNLDNNISNENTPSHSEITNTPPLSTKCGSNNCNKIKNVKTGNKILFYVKNYNNKNIINNENNNYNNNNNNNIINNKNNKYIFSCKKRKRVFEIKKIKRQNKESIKKINIFKQHFPKKHLEININNDNKKNIIIDILIDKNNNNNIINNNLNISNNNNNEKDENKEKVKDKDKDKDKNINIKKKNKKNNYINEKELQLNYEKKFLENINKEYSDKEYENDMKECLNNKKLKFMKDNFPIMFLKDKYYLYSILPKKRQENKEYFIESNYFNKIINENLFNYYDILYTDYDLSFKEQSKEINLNNSNIINKKININNENVSNNNLINNKILYDSNTIEYNEEIENKYDCTDIVNYKYNKNIKKNNKNKIFIIFKEKKLFKNKNIIETNKKKNKNKNEIKIDNNINNKNDINNLVINEKISLIPKKVWSLNNNKINIENFFEDCIQIWPFDECCFIKEIALEFLMKNDYSFSLCLNNIKEFVYFMKKRAQELDFPIINQSIKTIKKYNLRKTNFN